MKIKNIKNYIVFCDQKILLVQNHYLLNFIFFRLFDQFQMIFRKQNDATLKFVFSLKLISLSIRPSVDARRIWESFLNFKLSSGPVRKVKRNWRAKGARRPLIRREPFWEGADWLSLGYVSPIHTAQKHQNHSPRWILGSKIKVTVRSCYWDARNSGLGSFCAFDRIFEILRKVDRRNSDWGIFFGNILFNTLL